jgi:hypothetical protein
MMLVVAVPVAAAAMVVLSCDFLSHCAALACINDESSSTNSCSSTARDDQHGRMASPPKRNGVKKWNKVSLAGYEVREHAQNSCKKH